MKDSIFDLIQDDISEGKVGYLEIAEKAPEPKNNSFFNQVKDYGKTFLKGAIEGISQLGTIMGPLPATGKTSRQELEEQTETLNELLPTDEGFTQKAIRRGLRMAPSVVGSPIGGPVQAGIRSVIAGFAGEGAKELGAPEWAQAAAEITIFLGPDITKKLLEKGSNADLIAAARKLGMSDEATTPLLQSDFKQKWLSKLAPRRGSTQTALEKSKSELQKSYGKIQSSDVAKNVLSDKSSINLINKIESTFEKMPSSVRSKIKTDYLDLVKNNPSGENLMNFWADINHELGGSTKQLSLLKEHIKEAITEISPEMVKDFENMNALYSKYFPIAKKLEPNLQTDIMGAAKSLGLLGGLLTGNYQLLAQFASPAILGKLSQQLLLNPRFQQLSRKIVEAINQNKYALAKKTSDLIARELEKISPELSKEVEKLSEEDFINMLKSQSSSKG